MAPSHPRPLQDRVGEKAGGGAKGGLEARAAATQEMQVTLGAGTRLLPPQDRRADAHAALRRFVPGEQDAGQSVHVKHSDAALGAGAAVCPLRRQLLSDVEI